MSMLCSDKTGTLTTANMSIIEDQIYAADGFGKEEVIKFAFLCSNADKKDDPIDKAIVSAFEKSAVSSDGYTQTEIIGFNPSVKRVVAFVSEEGSGNTITIAKGLPAKIMDTAAGGDDDHELQWKVDTINNRRFIEEVTNKDKNLSSSGYKTIAIAICKGVYAVLFDFLPLRQPPDELVSNHFVSFQLVLHRQCSGA